jgi:hypothetical protein
MTPAERFAHYIGRPIADAEHGIGIVRGGLQRMVADGTLPRLPDDDEIVTGLIAARAGIDVRNEMAAEAATVKIAVYADGRVPTVAMPRRARVAR